jgi:mRNA interferase RelE/StbE
MDVQIKKSFSKDVDKIHDKKLLNSIFEIITQVQQAASIKEIKHIKKLEGSKKHYRVKIGDYRLGLCIEDKTVFIVRFLHRKEIYRYFP